MAYCPKCGVQLDPAVRVCPLDDTPVPLVEGDSTPPAVTWSSSDPYAKVHATAAEIRRQVFALLTGILVLGIVVVFSVDFFLTGGFQGGRLTWSLPAAWSLLSSIGYLVVGFRLYHAFLPLTLSYLGITALLMAGLDALDANEPWSWFLELGLPVLVVLLVALVVSYTYILHTKVKSYNVFGMIFGAAAVFLVLLDILVFLYLRGAIFVSWSVVTSLALVPLSLFFFYLHYVVKRKVDLGRTFHF